VKNKNKLNLFRVYRLASGDNKRVGYWGMGGYGRWGVASGRRW